MRSGGWLPRVWRRARPCRRWRSATASTPICCSPGGVGRQEDAAGGALEPLKLLPVTVADEGMPAAPIALSGGGRPDGDRARRRRADCRRSRMDEPRSRLSSTCCRGDDPGPGGRSGVACARTTDMRKGFDGLALLVQETLKRDPHCGHLFVFRGQAGRFDQMPLDDGRACACSPSGWKRAGSCGHRQLAMR